MNKPQYLAELGQLLIFMTHADREKTLARYGALFDAAGPNGQDDLLAKLGSTTRQAIRLSRIYDAAGGYEDAFLDDMLAEAQQAPAPGPASAPEPEQKPEPSRFASLVGEELPDFDLPDLPDLPDAPVPESADAPASDAVPAPSSEQTPPDSGAAAPAGEPAADSAPADEPGDSESAGETAGGGEDDADYEALWGKRPAPAAESEAPAEEAQAEQEPEDGPVLQPERPSPAVYTTVERVIPLWLGIPLFALTVVFIVLPLAALCLVLIPTLLIPGLAILLGAFLAFVGGLWCISIIADAAVLFGSALILLALGLIILWCGLWIDVSMVSGFARALRGLAHLTLGKKVTVHA